ncbi:MAG: DUF1405 domain-containing protein [Patescibacteria group bacterium]
MGGECVKAGESGDMPGGLSGFFLRRRWLLWLILAVNLLASVYGYYWYRWQLKATPFTLWFFTPDCPLAATLMAVALAIYLVRGRRDTWFQFLTYTILIKYGFWTVFVFLLYWATGGAYHAEYVMLCLSHLGMLAEGAVFLGSVPQKTGFWWLAAAWSLVDVYFDYFHPVRIAWRRAIGVYPYLPNDTQRPVILLMTLGISFAFIITAAVLTLKRIRRRRPG